MDSKKITRRVVLGTVLGGLTVAPFVVRALRTKNEINVPHGLVYPCSEAREQFFETWKKHHKILSIKTTPLESPKTVTMKYNFSKRWNKKFCYLETYFGGKNFVSPETANPDNIMIYTFMEGSIQVKENEPGKIFVSIDQHERKNLELDYEASQKNGAKVIEKQITKTDGTISVSKIIKQGFYYDSEERCYKTDVIEKEGIQLLPTGQFVLNQDQLLDLDREYLTKIIHKESMVVSLARFAFYPLFRFPIPVSPVKSGQIFECPTNWQDILYFQYPIHNAGFKGMVNWNHFILYEIVPEFKESLDSYCEYMRKQFWQSREDQLSENTQDKYKKMLENILMEKIKRLENGYPQITYLIDSETGGVVRREEQMTGEQNGFSSSFIQRIFQIL